MAGKEISQLHPLVFPGFSKKAPLFSSKPEYGNPGRYVVNTGVDSQKPASRRMRRARYLVIQLLSLAETPPKHQNTCGEDKGSETNVRDAQNDAVGDTLEKNSLLPTASSV